MSTLTAIQKTLQAQANAKAVKLEPNSADTSLVESRELGVLIQGSNATVKNSSIAGGVTLIGGEPNRESIEGGDITLQGGHQTLSQSTSQAGNVNIFSGDGYRGGDVWIVGGDNLDSGASSLTGSITIQTGGQDRNSSSNTGSILAQTGHTIGAYQSGSLTFMTGTVRNNLVGTTRYSGEIVIESGGGNPSVAGYSASGDVSIKSGTSQDSSTGGIELKSGNNNGPDGTGAVDIRSGNASNQFGSSGNLILRSGSAGNGSGDVTLKVGDTNVAASIPGLLTIGGSDKPNGATNVNYAGSVIIEGGKVNGVSDFGPAGSYGGSVEINAYGYGQIVSSAYSIEHQAYNGYLQQYSSTFMRIGTRDNASFSTGYLRLTTGESLADDSGTITIESGRSFNDSVAGAYTSGDLDLKTGEGAGANSGDILLTTGRTVEEAVNGIKNSGDILLTTGQTLGDADSGSIELTTGDTGLGANSGDITFTTGTASGFSRSGDITFTTGENITSGRSGDITFTTGDVSSSYPGDITIEPGRSPSVNGGSVYIYGGGSDGQHGGYVFIKGGEGNDPGYDFWGVQIQGSTLNFTSTDNYRSDVNIVGGPYYYDNAVVLTDNTVRGGDVSITGGSVVQGASVLTENDGTGTQDLGEVKVVSGSVPTTSGLDQRLLTIQADGVLKSLGLTVLGYTTVDVEVPVAGSVNRVPIFCKAATQNTLDLNGSSTSYVTTTTESAWTGIPLFNVITGLLTPGIDFDKIMVVASYRFPTISNLEVTGSPAVASSLPISVGGVGYYIYLNYSTVATANNTGIRNITGNSAAKIVKAHYIFLQRD